jgi:hypothetical protein
MRKKHYAIFIPPRGEQLEREALTPTLLKKQRQIDFDDSVFAEIEFEADAFGPPSDETERRFFASIPEAQPIGRAAFDPIRQRVYEMRSLASGNPFGRNDKALFYKQAKFMEDFTDDFEGMEPFTKADPNYQVMGYEQLRTYFTWRARTRSGEAKETFSSYVYLHVCELLSNVGTESPEDGLNKLTALWTECRKWEPSLDQRLPQWLMDYHICYELPRSFADYAKASGLQSYFPEAFYATGDLMIWNAASSYDVTKSKFYLAGNEELLSGCFSAVVGAIRESCPGLERLFLHSKTTIPWRPFQRSLASCPAKQRDRQVGMPGGEVYTCKDGRWTAEVLLRDSRYKDMAAALIKKTEACLREAVKYRFRITVPAGPYDSHIERAVREFITERSRTVVTVDHRNLARIRKEAQGTREKLVVEEVVPEPIAAEPAVAPPPVEIEAIAALLSGSKTLKQFAAEHGLMPEVLADGINEKAADYFGDNLLDDDMAIYDEYIEKAKEMAGSAGRKQR